MPPKYLLGHLGRGLRCSCSAAEFDWAAAYYPQASSAFTPPGRPICFLSHIPFPGVSCSSDFHLFGIGAQEPEHLSLCSLSLSLSAFSVSLCLYPPPSPPAAAFRPARLRPTSCSLAPRDQIPLPHPPSRKRQPGNCRRNWSLLKPHRRSQQERGY